MGFLDNLLKKETRKIISSVVDTVVDGVTDSIKDSLGASGTSSTAASGTLSASAPTGTVSSGSAQSAKHTSTASASKSSASIGKRKASGLEGISGDDEDCYYEVSVIRSRIEKVAAEDWPSYELRKNIPAEEVGGGAKDQGFDYGLYLDGQPKLMIMILDQYQYRNKCVQRSHQACRSRGIGSFHLLNHLPNRKTYIAERMKECMPN